VAKAGIALNPASNWAVLYHLTKILQPNRPETSLRRRRGRVVRLRWRNCNKKPPKEFVFSRSVMLDAELSDAWSTGMTGPRDISMLVESAFRSDRLSIDALPSWIAHLDQDSVGAHSARQPDLEEIGRVIARLNAPREIECVLPLTSAPQESQGNLSKELAVEIIAGWHDEMSAPGLAPEIAAASDQRPDSPLKPVAPIVGPATEAVTEVDDERNFPTLEVISEFLLNMVCPLENVMECA
jgi:hypothetical protein